MASLSEFTEERSERASGVTPPRERSVLDQASNLTLGYSDSSIVFALAPRGYVISRTRVNEFTEERSDPRRDTSLTSDMFSLYLVSLPVNVPPRPFLDCDCKIKINILQIMKRKPFESGRILDREARMARLIVYAASLNPLQGPVPSGGSHPRASEDELTLDVSLIIASRSC